jgi:hypothetical protein
VTDTTEYTIPQLLTDYTSFVTEGYLLSSNYQNAARVMSTVFSTLLDDPTDDNLQHVWNFYVAHQNDIVEENTALYGISVLSPNDRTIYSILYAMFRQATNGFAPAGVDDVLSLIIRAPIVVDFLQQESLSRPQGSQLPNIGNTVPTGFTPGSIPIVDLTPASASTNQTYLIQCVSGSITWAPKDTSAPIDLTPYATKTWVQSQGYLTSVNLTGYATLASVQQQGYLTSANLVGYATTSWVQTQGYLTSVDLTSYATQSWVTGQGYLTPASLSTYATISYVTTQNYATTSAVAATYAAKASLAAIATSGLYSDLTGTPSLAPVATSGAYASLTGRPTLATVATSGSYTDLSNKPAIAEALVWQGTWNATTNTPTLISGTGISGGIYTVTTAGTTTLDGYSSWAVGDKAVFNGITNQWEKIDGSPTEVLSVAGKIGAVTLTHTDISDWTSATAAFLTSNQWTAGPVATVIGGSITSGTLTIAPYVLPIASVSVLGGIKVDGTTVIINSGTGVISSTRRYIVCAWMYGTQASPTQNIGLHKFVAPVVFPANFGSIASGETSVGSALVAATATTVFQVLKCPAAADPSVGGNWTNVGTITVAAGTYLPVFTTAAAAPITFAEADMMRISGTTSDSTMADLTLSLWSEPADAD